MLMDHVADESPICPRTRRRVCARCGLDYPFYYFTWPRICYECYRERPSLKDADKIPDRRTLTIIEVRDKYPDRVFRIWGGLNAEDQRMMIDLMNGELQADIARKLRMSRAGVSKRFKRIGDKFIRANLPRPDFRPG